MNLFLSPHNDDESLFGAYIIQTYNPLVVIVTDSHIQFDRGEKMASAAARRLETLAAMSINILGVEVEFLGISDQSDGPILREKFEWACDSYQAQGFENVFAPAIEEGGNWQHNLIGKIADERFDNVRHYYTYTRERDFPLGPVKVDVTDEMKAKKLAALECYKSQWANVCRMYFTQANKDEYLDR